MLRNEAIEESACCIKALQASAGVCPQSYPQTWWTGQKAFLDQRLGAFFSIAQEQS
jgi:hypothetical protein